MRLRVFAVDDNQAVLHKLVSVLSREFDVVGSATSSTEALQSIRQCHPDIVVTDLTMPGCNGIELTRKIRADANHPQFVICSTERDHEIVQATKEAGALGFVFKARMETDLIPAVMAAGRGQCFLSPS